MIDELDMLMVDTLRLKKESETSVPVSPISLIDAYIEKSDLSNTNPKLQTFRDGLTLTKTKRAGSLPQPDTREFQSASNIQPRKTHEIQKAVSMLDSYIHTSDLADTGGNLSSFREVLILRGRIKRNHSVK
jgi:hypothetical protein